MTYRHKPDICGVCRYHRHDLPDESGCYKCGLMSALSTDPEYPACSDGELDAVRAAEREERP